MRRAFLGTSYGPPGERWHLGGGPRERPSWSAPGQRWAILTAWNPRGERHERESNEIAQARLCAELTGWPHLEGVNGEGDWAEPSLIVPNLPLGRAAELGRRYEQAAVLWGVGRRAALVWCRSTRLERCWLRGHYTSLP